MVLEDQRLYIFQLAMTIVTNITGVVQAQEVHGAKALIVAGLPETRRQGGYKYVAFVDIASSASWQTQARCKMTQPGVMCFSWNLGYTGENSLYRVSAHGRAVESENMKEFGNGSRNGRRVHE